MAFKRIGVSSALLCLVLILLLSGCQTNSFAPSQQPTPQLGILQPLSTKTPTPAFSQAGDETPIPSITPTQQIYTVQKDELGWSIASRFKLTLPELQAANPGVDLNFLKEGTQLQIPQPLATPDPILNTPTPVAVTISTPICYPAAQQQMWCIANISNPLSNDIYFLTGDFFVDGANSTSRQPAALLLDRLPAGANMPIMALFPQPESHPVKSRFALTNGFTLDAALEQPITIDKLSIEYNPAGASAIIKGEILSNGQESTQINLVAAAYQDQTPAGVRKQVLQINLAAQASIPFEIIVYSVGPRINRVSVFAEAQ